MLIPCLQVQFSHLAQPDHKSALRLGANRRSGRLHHTGVFQSTTRRARTKKRMITMIKVLHHF